MAADEPATEGLAAKPSRRIGRRWQQGFLLTLLGMGAVAAALLAWLDTSSGHRFIISRIEALRPPSGLQIEVGAIEGSVYRNAVLRDVILRDGRGRFLTIPETRLEWWPISWLSNRLSIDSLTIPLARLHRMPSFTPSRTKGPILPGFDVRVMRFEVGRLDVEKPVAGRTQSLTMGGDIDIRSGRAVVELSARALDGDDRLVLALDSRPDDNVFDIDLTVNAAQGGVLAAMAGLNQSANIRVKGDGDWQAWNGSLIATLDQKSAAGLTLRARAGTYQVTGVVEGAAVSNPGLLGRLASPNVRIDAKGTLVNRLLSGTVALRSDAIAIDAKGGVNFAGRGYDNVTVDLALQRPSAVLAKLGGRSIAARARLHGPFNGTRFEYLITAAELRMDKTRLFAVKAAGTGQMNGPDKPTLIPLTLSAARVEGSGDVVASILRNLRVTGTLQKSGSVITGIGPLTLRSDKLSGRLVVLADLKSGRYDLALAGDIRGLLINGLGIVDIRSAVKAAPAVGGAFGLSGVVEADVRRLDNSFLRTLGGGLPRVRSKIALDASGQLLLQDLSLRAPLLTLNGGGRRLADGTVDLHGSGRHGRYGPLTLRLTGNVERPEVGLVLADPLPSAKLSNVRLQFDPDVAGYAFSGGGLSVLGPFATNGRIELPRGKNAVITIQALKIADVTARGALVPVAGGLSGQLAVTGAVSGTVTLSLENAIQKIAAMLEARNANFDGPPAISVRRGTLDATLLLRPTGTTVDATVQARGLQIATMRVNNLAANIQMQGDNGHIRASLSGQRGRLFALQIDAAGNPDKWRIAMNGSLDRKVLRLSAPAILSREGASWRLAPVTIAYAGGSARIGGTFGPRELLLEAAMSRLPLSLLDITDNDLGLSGTASGTVTYMERPGTAPTGTAQLQLRGLTRSGVTRTSLPIDLGVNAQLSTDRLALRSTVVSQNKLVGRAQALISPLGNGSLMQRLVNAPIRAQLRYSGPAEAVWRLSRIEILDIGGRLAASANINGTLAHPLIKGSLATSDATVISPITGMRLTSVRASGQFDGAQLNFTSLSALARNGGTVTGSGRVDFTTAAQVGLDIMLQADNAEVLNRDDIGATVTGPITLKSDGNGGVVGGQLDIVRSRFVLGRAAAIAQIPELRVIERNGRQADFDAPVPLRPWQLAIKARARNRLMVSGLGLNSEWRMTMDIGGDVSDPVLVGTAQLVRGSYDFAGRRFDMTEGELRFDGTKPVNPSLDVTAEGSVTGLSAVIRVTGTSANPIISFTSTPALPEDEVLSRILFGSSITQLSAPEAIQLAAAVASLRGGSGGLDPINAVRKAAGLDRLRILPADTTTGQGTSVAVGKYLTRKTYVELVTDGQGYSATRVEYQVTRWLSLLGSVSTIGRQSATVRVSRDY